MQENVILIDTDDNVIGTMEKMDAHVQGKLHRAFSVFI
jgi:isopentenyl-diphosphate delta-isomerase